MTEVYITGAAIVAALSGIIFIWDKLHSPQDDEWYYPQCSPSRVAITAKPKAIPSRTDYVGRKWRWRGLELGQGTKVKRMVRHADRMDNR